MKSAYVFGRTYIFADFTPRCTTPREKCGLVISDIDMPRVDGWSLARRVRMGAVETCRDVPIVMLTANNSDRNQQKATIHKITGYLVKPPTPDAVKGILSSL